MPYLKTLCDARVLWSDLTWEPEEKTTTTTKHTHRENPSGLLGLLGFALAYPSQRHMTRKIRTHKNIYTLQIHNNMLALLHKYNDN